MKPLTGLFGLVALLTAVCVTGMRAAEVDFALGVRTTEPLTPAEQRQTFQLPPGFEIQLVAAEPDIHKPMNLAFDAAGRLWVTTSIEYPWAAPTNRPARDRLMIFDDFGPDGRARKVTEFAGGLNIPIGVYPFRTDERHWKALVWSIPHIWLLEDTDADGKADRRTPLYGPFDHTRDTHGNQASFRRGFDGWLYATHGFNNDSHVTARDGSRADLNSGNTYRLRLDGSRIEQHTFGQVNPFGLAWDPRGNLYSSDCHSAPIYQLLAGGYYPSFGKPHDGLGFAPAMLEHAHGSTAIDGAFYYADNLWPAEYQDMFLIGNVMTSRLNRDRITFVGSTPKAIEQPDFLTTTDPWFRPVDNTLGPDGALYVADFYNRIIGHYEVPLTHPGRDRERGRIWRVVYRGTDGRMQQRPAALPGDLAGLLRELESANLPRRMLAMSEIEDRFGAAAGPALRERAAGKFRVPQGVEGGWVQTSALWLLQRLSRLDWDTLAAASGSPDALVRTHAQRLVAERGLHLRAGQAGAAVDRDAEAARARRVALQGLADADALVRRCAAEGLGAWRATANVQPLLEALAAADPADTHLVYVLRKALRDQLLEASIFHEVAGRALSARDTRAVVDVALAVKSEAAGAFLIRHSPGFADDADLSRRALQHAARYGPPAALDELAAVVQRNAAGDLDFQYALFGAVRDGLVRRGVELTDVLRAWAGALALQMLDSLGSAGGWLSEPLDAPGAAANLWGYRDRKQSDTGEPARMLDSSVRGETLTGRLVSQPFTAPGQIRFFLAGHDGDPGRLAPGKNVVRLRDAASGEILAVAKPPRNDVAQPVTWDLAAQAGRKVQLEVVDGDSAGAFAWLAVGRFQPPAVPALVLAPERQVAAAELAAAAGVGAESPLMVRLGALARDAGASLAARAAVLRLLSPAGAAIADLVADARVSLVWKTLLVNMAAAGDARVAAETRARIFKEAPQSVQVRVALLGLVSAEAAKDLVAAMATGAVPPSLLRDEGLLGKLNGLADAEVKERLRELQAAMPKAEAGIQRLIDQRGRDYAAAKADPEQGRQLFVQLCGVCHQLGGQGTLVGPQLDGIGKRGVERLLEDILDPNRNVDHAFATTTLVLKNGEVESGLMRREEGAVWVLANAAGAEFTVNKADVRERRQSNLSLMPANFGEALSAEQMSQLLAFLLTK